MAISMTHQYNQLTSMVSLGLEPDSVNLDLSLSDQPLKFVYHVSCPIVKLDSFRITYLEETCNSI